LNLDDVWDGGSAGHEDEASTWDWQLPYSKDNNIGVDVGHPTVTSGDFVA